MRSQQRKVDKLKLNRSFNHSSTTHLIFPWNLAALPTSNSSISTKSRNSERSQRKYGRDRRNSSPQHNKKFATGENDLQLADCYSCGIEMS